VDDVGPEEELAAGRMQAHHAVADGVTGGPHRGDARRELGAVLEGVDLAGVGIGLERGAAELGKAFPERLGVRRLDLTLDLERVFLGVDVHGRVRVGDLLVGRQQAGGVVGMDMGDDHRVDRCGIDAGGG
jgi:hypothetical protein